jgi:hypothetical protein
MHGGLLHESSETRRTDVAMRASEVLQKCPYETLAITHDLRSRVLKQSAHKSYSSEPEERESWLLTVSSEPHPSSARIVKIYICG